MAQKRTKKVAVVNCSSGGGECAWGCLGLGDCAAACKPGAIAVGESGAAEVDRDKCAGCGLCVKACPRGLIRLAEPAFTILTRCASKADGPATRKVCATGCIACGICAKTCPAGAISVVENHAVIDEAKCIACGMCAVKCPRGTVADADHIFTN